MLKNDLVVAWRNLRRYRVISLINVMGLGVGIACCIAIVLVVLDQLSYDAWNAQAGQIYRVHLRGLLGTTEINIASSAAPLAFAIVRDFPEVAAVTRIKSYGEPMIRVGAQSIREKGFYWVDSTFPGVFTVPFIKGNPGRALSRPNTAVITETAAKTYFGGDDPLGKMLRMEGFGERYEITGVVRDCPPNAHFHYNVLASLATFEQSRTPYWLQCDFYTYVVLRKGTSPDDLQTRLNKALMNYVGPQIQQATGATLEQLEMKGGRYEYVLQPLTSIHLSSHLDSELEPNSDISSVYIFSSIAAAILLLAIINFMNLSTARSEKRAKEVGIRKALGSGRAQLVRQFIAESILMSTIAVCFAVSLVMLFIPSLRDLAGSSLRVDPFGILTTLIVLFGTAVGVGLLAGVYPAFSLSSFNPAQMLRHGVRKGNKGTALRNGLVVFQFAVSIILIVGTLMIRDQLGYMRSKDLGFTKEHVIIVDVSDIDANRLALFTQELLNSPRVTNLSNATAIPGRIDAYSQSTYRMKDAPAENAHQLWWMSCDTRFGETYRIRMADGTFFDERSVPGIPVAVINQEAAKVLQLQNPVGSRLVAMGEGGKTYTVIGVVKDFNFESLRQSVRPLVMQRLPEGNTGAYLSVRISPGNVEEAVNAMKTAWEKCGSGSTFAYEFLDEELGRLYKSEQRTNGIAALFSFLAISIACLGLFGLATFVTEQRTKEIGIRKVLGASVSAVVVLLTKEFVKWVLVAMVIAWPIAYFVMERWLQDFAFRISIGFWSFMYAGLLALTVAILTVCGQAVKAALTNPVDNLRYE